MTGNLLHRETSPYLLQHKDNPVHWRPWGPDALAEAEARSVPILLSIGYAACHWCHVMAHESFEDPETAEVMNRLFVNIKVDREERPDIDTIYMTALQMMGQPGGWPLTMFLTPKGEPFWGGTYFPKEPGFGRPGFKQILERVAALYHEEPDKVAQNRDALVRTLNDLSSSPQAGTLTPSVLDQAAEMALSACDPVHGGIGAAPKFPNPGLLELLWRAYLRTDKEAYRTAVTSALDHMCQGGIYDHLGGGFARYSVDARWLVPHFEKMLYDNAQLIELLTLAWQDTRSPLYAARVAETVAWTVREMTAEGGGFAASLDADSEGEEGKFYVWRAAEIDTLLPPDDAALFKRIYDASPDGNWEGVSILNRLDHMDSLSDADETRLAKAREVLFRARARRVRPGWDDKVLSDWNGLMIHALAVAGHVFKRADWLDAAVTAFGFICDSMGEGGRLYHSCRLGRARHAAIADGYANMARAALTLYQIAGKPDDLARAEAWVSTLNAHYWDSARGGYFLTADDAEALITRTRSATDGPVPNANGTMVCVLMTLYHLRGIADHRDRAEKILNAFAGELARNGLGMAAFVNGYDLYEHAVQMVIIGARGEADTDMLLGAAASVPAPNLIAQVVGDGAALPAGHPAAGKTRIDGKPTAYLCKGQTCTAPVTEPRALADLIAAMT